MELFHAISVFVPLAILLLTPRVLARHGYSDKGKRWLLALACGLFFASWYLPSPLVDGQDMSLVTHLVGGGIFSGLLWLYLMGAMKLKLSWWGELLGLLALVSALGVTNELFELALVRSGLATILITDTSWDLLANTIGALAVFVVYRIGRRLDDRRHR